MKRGYANKKGLSDVVTTIMIILLAIVVVGLLFLAVRNFAQKGSEQIDVGTKCIAVNLEVDSVVPVVGEDGNYSVTLKRGAGGDEIGGVKINIFNGTANTGVIEFGVAISPLDTKTQKLVGVTGANKIEATAYFTDASGADTACSQTVTKTF